MPRVLNLVRTGVGLVALAGCASAQTHGVGLNPALEQGLRAARVALDRGNASCAFVRTEAVRRGEDEAQFRSAFDAIVRDLPRFDPSPQAELALRVKVSATPNDAHLLLELADIYTSRGDWENAIPLVRRAMALLPDSLEPVAVLGRIESSRGNAEAAKQLLEAFTTAHPDSPEAALLGALRAQGPARILALEAAAQRHPDDALVAFHFASEVQASGDLPRAEGLFVRAATLGKDNAMIQAWTARFYLKELSRPAEALQYYYRAYFLDPNFYETEFVEARIGRLLSTTVTEDPCNGP